MNIISLIKKNFFVFFLYFFLIFLLFYDFLLTKYDYTHTFFIKNNQSLNDIARNLNQEKIIESENLFKFIVRINMAEKILKAGEYKFYKNNIFQIISKIKKGNIYLRKITFPEGFTSKEIINIIKKTEGIFINDEIRLKFIEEGNLYPSTYFYAYGTDFNIIINNMKKRMLLTLENAWKNRDENLGLSNYNEVLILASLIEKETSRKDEKPIIAQIFLNRLKLNMKLQSDPSVIYGIEQDLGIIKKDLNKKDLKHKSKYNTYLNYGLPKGPICNPGEDSIIAATKPYKGDLLYFVADGEGGHNFSKDYKGHIKNVNKFREIKNR